ncbi:metal ABC transporter solute-binding protein, Zn/Mn family [Haloactinomyces albus]|uniref:Zinc/manganese transport system substrate-binding protein n=1 Tax=Haloactinomyces albus TaxID=1352928 RepID=A0AAE4CKY6_9ACTN|nr:zinc ABC transporter substrate-binding protein [Haloactinomyces albus]MDR7301645.1 zinc/manganese transport system substrate-binding protein [Haloactinomyces albus]
MNTVRNRRVRRSRGAAVLAGLTAVALVMTACGTGEAPEMSRGAEEELTVVTSTSMWGSVARAVGGNSVEVESIIDNAEADPHSYEGTPRDAAAISDAELVVFNGGGFDSFVQQILSATGDGSKPVVEAFRIADENEQHHGGAATENEHHSGHEHGSIGHVPGHGHHSSANEHVWYDLGTVGEVADRIADELARIRPEKAHTFHAAAAEFNAEVHRLDERLAHIAANHRGEKVITTAPVADLLVERAELDDITPPSFVQAAESGSDPSAVSVAEIQDLVDSRRAAVLIHNPQTASPLTERLRHRAQRNGIPVVPMTGTLPVHSTYTEWMRSQISDLQNALVKNS